jgi:hypothetical protein
VRALGGQAEVKASRPSKYGEPSLVKAMLYPDRRVQFAAAQSLLRIPGTPSPQAAARAVEVLARALEADNMAGTRRKLLVAFADDALRQAVGKAVTDASAEPVLVGTGREALRRLTKASDIDAVVLDSTLGDPTLPYVMAQLRADARTKGLPVLLTAVPEGNEARDLLRAYRDAKAKLGDIEVRAQAYRDKRRQLQADYEAELFRLEDRLKEIQALTIQKGEADKTGVPKEKKEELLKDQKQQIEDLKVLHETNLKELARRFPEPAHLDQEGQRLEARLKVLDKQFEVVSGRREDALRRSYERDRALQVVSANVVSDPAVLAATLRLGELETATPLTPEEIRQNAEKAVKALARMARGDLAGYSAGPAAEAVYGALRAAKLPPDALKAAVEFAGRQSGAKPQGELATVVLDAKLPAEVRTDAARELVRHVQKYGALMPAPQVTGLRELYAAKDTDRALRANLADLQGALRPDARTTGQRLLDQPLPETGTPKEKDKDKEKDK